MNIGILLRLLGIHFIVLTLIYYGQMSLLRLVLIILDLYAVITSNRKGIRVLGIIAIIGLIISEV